MQVHSPIEQNPPIERFWNAPGRVPRNALQKGTTLVDTLSQCIAKWRAPVGQLLNHNAMPLFILTIWLSCRLSRAELATEAEFTME
jgi:hypothetical protein